MIKYPWPFVNLLAKGQHLENLDIPWMGILKFIANKQAINFYNLI